MALCAPFCAADNNNPITLDTNETLFTVLTALNTCGYDVNLNGSDAQRLNIRAEVQRSLRESEEAQQIMTTMCDWYQAHRGRDPAHDLSQYISLALYLQGPPHFLPKVKEDEMPPDAAPIAAFGAILSASTTRRASMAFGSATARTMLRWWSVITFRWPRWCSIPTFI